MRNPPMWFVGVEVEQETSAPSPQKNPGSAPVNITIITMQFSFAKIIICRLRRVTRDKGQSSILHLSQFRRSNEILVNNVKFFPHENSLSLP